MDASQTPSTTAVLSAPDKQVRATQIALILNAIAATSAAMGYVLGLVPYASQYPLLARRAAAGEFAGAIIFAVTSRWLPRDRSLLLFPLVFVTCQLADSVYELAVNRSSLDVPPLVIEGIFFAIYVAMYLRMRRAGSLA